MVNRPLYSDKVNYVETRGLESFEITEGKIIIMVSDIFLSFYYLLGRGVHDTDDFNRYEAVWDHDRISGDLHIR